MKRLLFLSLMVVPVAALSAGDPVSVYPPVPGGSLSQSLPSVINGGLSTVPTVPPVMVGQSSWGTPAFPPSCPPQSRYVTPGPVLTPRVATPCDTGCGSRGNLLQRLRAWLCGGPGPAIHRGLVFAPPVAPLREWTPTVGYVTANGPAGWPSGCDSDGGRRFPMGRFGGHGVSDARAPAAGPRPILIPLPSGYDCAAGCGRSRPGLLRRLLSSFIPGWFSEGWTSPPTLMTDSTVTAPQPIYGPVTTTEPMVGQPVPVSTGLTGGYHFASTTTPTSPMVKMSNTPTAAPVPLTATQPFTRQR